MEEILRIKTVIKIQGAEMKCTELGKN